MRSLLLTALIGIFGGGCGHDITARDIIGTYVADYGFATDAIVFKRDRYIQTVHIRATGRTVVGEGTWSYNQITHNIKFGGTYMQIVDGYGNVSPSFDRPDTASQMIGPVRSRFGKLEIGGDDLFWGRTGAETPYKRQ